jgi:hypothetical protein
MALFRKILGSVLLKDDTWIDLDGVLGIENGLKRGRFCLALAVASTRAVRSSAVRQCLAP